MATYIAYRDGGKTDEVGLSRMTSKLWAGNVLEGLAVQQSDTPAMNITVAPGDIKIDQGSGCYYAWLDSNATVTIATASTSNPRIDRIVAYIDTAQTPTTAQANNPGLLKFAAIAGTPAATPSAPSDSTVQSVIGVGNPYADLANVAVNTSVSQIIDSNITDTRDKITTITGGHHIGVVPKATFGTTGNKAITGLGFKPRLVRFTAMPSPSPNSNWGYGTMTESSQFWAAVSGSPARSSGTDGCIAWLSSVSGSSTPVMKAAYVSMDNDGFTINVVTPENAFDIAYEACA